MRDPINWALPIYRLFGILVRVHLFFPIVALGVFLRLSSQAGNLISDGELFVFVVVLPFLLVLLHEYGHCFAARSVGGTADQILMWPLGGLAFVTCPETPRANFITTIAGPMVNLVICVICSLALLAGGYSPLKALNPLGAPFTTPTYNYRDGRTYTSDSVLRAFKSVNPEMSAPGAARDPVLEAVERSVAPGWVVWTWRICWLSWWLFLFNMLIPAYPMDAGRLLHAVLWARSDPRTATISCCYVGYATAALLLLVAIAVNEAFLLGIAAFSAFHCWRTLNFDSEIERNTLGYDFSQGYTSLDRDDERPPPPRRISAWRRWLQARQMRKLKEQHERQLADDARMDELLAKIARGGKQSLTDEERRFMERVSLRYKNRS